MALPLQFRDESCKSKHQSSLLHPSKVEIDLVGASVKRALAAYGVLEGALTAELDSIKNNTCCLSNGACAMLASL